VRREHLRDVGALADQIFPRALAAAQGGSDLPGAAPPSEGLPATQVE
jgi:hypothetical protein